MPTWGTLLQELITRAANDPKGQIPLDEMRQSSVAKLAQITGRPTVVYMTRWASGDVQRPEALMVAIEDVHSFMEVLHGLQGPSVDLILHSSGGSPTAAEAIVNYIRTRFDDVRVIVPLAAMSAATMMACGADRIVMGKHSYLGPIDPQFVLQTPLGAQMVPAQAIREQFALAQKDASNPANFPAWIPMLQQYGPGLLVQCANAIDLSERLVSTWLEKYMFRGMGDANALASAATKALNDHSLHKSHGRFLSRDILRNDIGLVVDPLESDQATQDAVLTVFHMYMHTFSMAPNATKIFENNIGRSFVRGGVVKAPGSIMSHPSGPKAPPMPPPMPPEPPGSHARQMLDKALPVIARFFRRPR